MPVRRRNAIRRRLEPARLALARLVQPQQQQQQQPQQQQQQQQQPTPGPQTDARPFSFDGREAITTALPTNPRHHSPTAPVTGPRPTETTLPRRQPNTAPSSGGQSQRGTSPGLYPPYQWESNLSAPERPPDRSFPESHDSSWTSAYEGDSSLGPTPAHRSSLPPGGGSLPLHPQHGRRRSLAVLSREIRASSNDLQAWRDLIPSNPFADDDEPAQTHTHCQGPPAQPALSAAPVAHAVRTSRRESMSSSVYSTGTGAGARARSRTKTVASGRVTSTGAAAGPSAPLPLPRQPSWSSAISEVSEASERRSVSLVRDFDNPRRRRRYGWDGSQMPRLDFPE